MCCERDMAGFLQMLKMYVAYDRYKFICGLRNVSYKLYILPTGLSDAKHMGLLFFFFFKW